MPLSRSIFPSLSLSPKPSSLPTILSHTYPHSVSSSSLHCPSCYHNLPHPDVPSVLGPKWVVSGTSISHPLWPTLTSLSHPDQGFSSFSSSFSRISPSFLIPSICNNSSLPISRFLPTWPHPQLVRLSAATFPILQTFVGMMYLICRMSLLISWTSLANFG